MTRTIFTLLGTQKFKIFIDRLFKQDVSVYTNVENVEELFKNNSLDQFYSIKTLNKQNNELTTLNELEIVST